MNADQRKEVARLYQASIDLEAPKLAQFLADACPNDEIRREVELLLAQRDDPTRSLEPFDPEVTAKMTPPEGQEWIGRMIGQYRVLARVGAGGMGVVYRAHDTRLDRDVALKVLPDEFSQDRELLARAEREARLLASLNHPNIAVIHDMTEYETVRCLVLEYIRGENWRKGSSGARFQ